MITFWEFYKNLSSDSGDIHYFWLLYCTLGATWMTLKTLEYTNKILMTEITGWRGSKSTRRHRRANTSTHGRHNNAPTQAKTGDRMLMNTNEVWDTPGERQQGSDGRGQYRDRQKSTKLMTQGSQEHKQQNTGTETNKRNTEQRNNPRQYQDNKQSWLQNVSKTDLICSVSAWSRGFKHILLRATWAL